LNASPVFEAVAVLAEALAMNGDEYRLEKIDDAGDSHP